MIEVGDLVIFHPIDARVPFGRYRADTGSNILGTVVSLDDDGIRCMIRLDDSYLKWLRKNAINYARGNPLRIYQKEHLSKFNKVKLVLEWNWSMQELD